MGPGDDVAPWAEAFVVSGRRTLSEWETALRAAGSSIAESDRVLEWGCGAGRVTIPLLDAYPSVAVVGVDPDKAALDWLRRQETGATLVPTAMDPPMPFADGEFDLVVNHSVLTHLNEQDQRSWLAELARVLEPGGLFVSSVHGLYAFSKALFDLVPTGVDPRRWVEQWRESGLVFVDVDGFIGSTHSTRYRSCFQKPESLEGISDYWFSVEVVFPRGALGFQDLLVLRRRSEEEHREARDRSDRLAPYWDNTATARTDEVDEPPRFAEMARSLAILTESVNRLGIQVGRVEDQVEEIRSSRPAP